MNNKNDIFSYMLTQLVDWYKEVKKVEEEEALNHFSKLSVLKLLFFIAAVPNGTEEKDLLDIFDNFSALPYGPVESDIYNAIRDNKIPGYTIGGKYITHNDLATKNHLCPQIRKRIDSSIKHVKDKKPKLITMAAFDLVDETHKWASWKNPYNFAQMIGQDSMPMELESIRKEASLYY